MKNYLSKVYNKTKKLVSFKTMNPHHHWMNLLYTFFGIIIILILFSFYLLYKIKNEQIFKITPSETGAPILINDELLRKVNTSFDNKALKEKEIREGIEVYIDPSI